MILSYEQIKNFTLGALSVVEDENSGQITFSRFSEKQLDFYRKNFEGYYLRAQNSAGVRLSFHTDASSLTLDYKMSLGSSENDFHIDVVCDSAIIKNEAVITDRNFCEGSLHCPLPSGEHHVSVHFPLRSLFFLKKFELSGETFVTQHKPKGPKILFLGDSITHGAFTPYPSLSYSSRLTQMLDADAINQAIGGEIFREGIIDGDINFEPDVITVAFGTNDWSCAKDDPMLRLDRAEKCLTKLKNSFPNAHIVYISPIWRGVLPEEQLSFDISCAGFKALAMSLDIDVIDGYTLVPHLPEFFRDKTLHPNELGFSLYAENLAVTLKKLGAL